MTEVNNTNINTAESDVINNADIKVVVDSFMPDNLEPESVLANEPIALDVKDKTMPQMEFDTFASQIFWLAITFGLLYVILARKAIPTIRDVLQNRQTRISEDLRKAEKLKEEAELAEADFTSVIVNARSTASSMLLKVRDNAAEESDRRNAKLDDTFARQTKESEHRIEVIKKEAISEMESVTVDIAQEMVKKLINTKVDKKKVEKAVLSASVK